MPRIRTRWGRLLAAVALLGLALLLPAGAGAQQPVPQDRQGRPLYVPGEVVVKLKPGMTLASVGNPANGAMSTARTLRRGQDGETTQLVRLGAGAGVEGTVAALKDDPAVEDAAPNYYSYLFLTPTDTRFGEQWGLQNTGQFINDINAWYGNNPGTGGDDIQATDAWNLSIGSGVIVAIIDSGVDYTHPDLVNQMWDGTGAANCPNGNPPVHGCDFPDNTEFPKPTPLPSTTHGTHVAGIVAAQLGAGDVVGVAPGARIMALQVFPDNGVGGATDTDIAAAINYAADNGASVINLSLGRGGAPTFVLTGAVQSAIAKGVVIVASAGNYQSGTLWLDNDTQPVWPANYAAYPGTAGGVLSVAATDQKDLIAYFSHYGANTVTIAAPGTNILSTISDGTQTYDYESGTSMASPMVAGIAALVKSINPTASPAQIKQRIVTSGDRPAGALCAFGGGKRANAYNAVAGIVTATPCGLVSEGSSVCLITWLTEDYVPRSALQPLREVREALWRQGPWGRALVLGYYRSSTAIIAWLRAARVASDAIPHTSRI